MRATFILLLVLIGHSLLAQKELRGLVTDEKGSPVAGASVYLNNTSIGTSTNDKGRFGLMVPQGKFDLIITSLGYETFSQTFTAAGIEGEVVIKLKEKAKVMETVVIEQFEKDGWNKWGRFFLEHFIGTSEHSRSCSIKNTETIRFRNDKKNGTLTAIALEPLVIENKSLGYIIRYQLEEFSFDFKSRVLIYAGYPFFEQMKGSKGKMERWEERRKKVYEGSIMHFMRSLYRNSLAENSFQVRRLIKVPNYEKQRVKEAYKQASMNSRQGPSRLSEDTSNYYNKIMGQPDENDIIGQHILPGDSIAFGIDSTVAGLQFDNYLFIHYTKGTAPDEYTMLFPQNGKAMYSQLKILSESPVEVYGNGMYFDGTSLLSLGYWAWAEKMSTMLPFDYKVRQ